jgi:hypothetical protein
MSYYIVDRMGGGDDRHDPSVDRMRFHLRSLDPEDEEHGSVRLVHRESGWGLEYFGDRLILQNTTIRGSQRHLIGISAERALELWKTLSERNIDEVMQESWKPGYV